MLLPDDLRWEFVAERCVKMLQNVVPAKLVRECSKQGTRMTTYFCSYLGDEPKLFWADMGFYKFISAK